MATAWAGAQAPTDGLAGQVALQRSSSLRPTPFSINMATVRKAIKNIASGKGAQKINPPTHSESDHLAEIELVSLPNAIPKQYPPLILVHVLLLSAALVLLPQTPLPDLPLPPPPRGLDKPQHPFLAPITARPVLTLAWACLGATLLVPWWAGSLRRWVHDGTLGSRNIQLRLRGDPHKQRVRVCSLTSLRTHFVTLHSCPHMQDIWNACVFTGYTALALHAVIILFGAPFVQYVCPTRVSAHIPFLSPLIPLPLSPGMYRIPPSLHFYSPYTLSFPPHTHWVHRVLDYRFSPRPSIPP